MQLRAGSCTLPRIKMKRSGHTGSSLYSGSLPHAQALLQVDRISAASPTSMLRQLN